MADTADKVPTNEQVARALGVSVQSTDVGGKVPTLSQLKRVVDGAGGGIEFVTLETAPRPQTRAPGLTATIGTAKIPIGDGADAILLRCNNVIRSLIAGYEGGVIVSGTRVEYANISSLESIVDITTTAIDGNIEISLIIDGGQDGGAYTWEYALIHQST